MGHTHKFACDQPVILNQSSTVQKHVVQASDDSAEVKGTDSIQLPVTRRSIHDDELSLNHKIQAQVDKIHWKQETAVVTRKRSNCEQKTARYRMRAALQ